MAPKGDVNARVRGNSVTRQFWWTLSKRTKRRPRGKNNPSAFPSLYFLTKHHKISLAVFWFCVCVGWQWKRKLHNNNNNNKETILKGPVFFFQEEAETKKKKNLVCVFSYQKRNNIEKVGRLLLKHESKSQPPASACVCLCLPKYLLLPPMMDTQQQQQQQQVHAAFRTTTLGTRTYTQLCNRRGWAVNTPK